MHSEPDQPFEYGYRESVMDYADQNENLSDSCVRQLLAEHSTSLSEFREDGYKGEANHAPSLLDWLGY